MQVRRFGKTELNMPVFSCGGMRYQQSWSDVPEKEIEADNQKNLEACIKRSVELGINHIETARGYGSSEYQLGKILPTFPRDELIVQTKIGPKESGKEFIEIFETSMKNLQLDYVDLLGVHGVNTVEISEMAVKPGGSVEAARELQKQGRIRHLGFSTHGPTHAIQHAVNTGAYDYINLHWYYVNPFTWPAVEDATKLDMGVFIISPNDKGGKLYEPPQKLVDLCAPYSPMVFNDLYCLSRPEVHTLSLGAAKPTDFDEHIKASELYDRREEISTAIAARLEEEMNRVLGSDWVQNWHVGIPKTEDTPGQINIHEILRLFNYAKALDMVEFGKMRYNLLGNADHWFPGHHVGSKPDEDLDAALADSPFRKEIPAALKEAHELLYTAPVKRQSESED